jgi:hypothetical protein
MSEPLEVRGKLKFRPSKENARRRHGSKDPPLHFSPLRLGGVQRGASLLRRTQDSPSQRIIWDAICPHKTRMDTCVRPKSFVCFPRFIECVLTAKGRRHKAAPTERGCERDTCVVRGSVCTGRSACATNLRLGAEPWGAGGKDEGV